MSLIKSILIAYIQANILSSK